MLRALRRHWWQILIVWFLSSTVLVYLAATKIRPSYEAASWLDVEPPQVKILTGAQTGNDFGPFLDTQVLLITSPDVLVEAIRDPEIANLGKIRSAVDAEVELRKEISVGIPQKGTHVIKVSMNGENPNDVANIVNAVVRAYLAKTKTWTDDASTAQIKNLADMERDLKKSVDDLKRVVRELTRKAGQADGIVGVSDGKGGEKDPQTFGKLQMTRDQYRNHVLELSRLRTQKYQAEAVLRYLEEEVRARAGVAGLAAGGASLSEEQLDEAVKQEFLANPTVMNLDNQIAESEIKYERALKRIPNRRDPTLLRVQEDLKSLQAQRQDMWETMKPRLRRQVLASVNGSGANAVDPAAAERERALSNARIELKRIQVAEKDLAAQVENATIEVQNANEQILDVKFAQDELTRQEQTLATVTKNREQLEFDARQVRIKLIAKAKPPKSPAGDHRLKAIAAGPAVMLILSCLLFMALEFRSGRVADPDELSQRIRVGVIGVVPPLPSLNNPNRVLSTRAAQNERRKVEEFVQSLDHLRVTLCSRPGPGSRDRRCVLITSAIGGEGKTTLAAQLAGRCANAGLMTLLIDADLRRPVAGRICWRCPEGPGPRRRADRATPAPETAMVVIGNAGGFHLLPAGTLGQDPSRLLHGDRLGKLIGPVPRDLRHRDHRRPAGPGRARRPADRPVDRRGGAGRPPRHQPVPPGGAGQQAAGLRRRPGPGRGGQRVPHDGIDLWFLSLHPVRRRRGAGQSEV